MKARADWPGRPGRMQRRTSGRVAAVFEMECAVGTPRKTETWASVCMDSEMGCGW